MLVSVATMDVESAIGVFVIDAAVAENAAGDIGVLIRFADIDCVVVVAAAFGERVAVNVGVRVRLGGGVSVGVNVGELVGVAVGVSVGASVGEGVKLATTGMT